MLAASGLNAGLFVSRDDEVGIAQWNAIPNAVVEIEDGAGLGRKVGIAGEDPASMSPRPEGIPTEPTPQGGTADFSDQALRNDVLPDLLDLETGQRKSECVGKLAGEGLNLNDEAGGKSGLSARLEAAPQGPACGRGRIASATC